jgi:hypothetical protein
MDLQAGWKKKSFQSLIIIMHWAKKNIRKCFGQMKALR